MASEEVWKNTTRGTRWYKGILPNGEITTHLVKAGSIFRLTPEERRLNQDSAADGFDLFTNGDFALEEASDETQDEEVKGGMSDAELRALLEAVEAGDKKLSKELADVTNVSVLLRVKEACEEMDMHQAKYKFVRDRLDEFDVENRTKFVTSKESFDNVQAPRVRGTSEAIGASRAR